MPSWIQHSVLGQKADVAAIIVYISSEDWRNVAGEANVPCINDRAEAEEFSPQVGMDVSIVGYPRGLSASGFAEDTVLPIWKRGVIASEPHIDFDGVSAFLVDAWTTEGMSGSPVVLRSFGGYADARGNWRIVHPAVSTKFLGIYAGRITMGSQEIGIGKVFKRSVIEQLIESPARGDFDLAS